MSLIGETLRRGWITWSAYWNKLLVKIFYYTINFKYPYDLISNSTAIVCKSKRLLLLGLMDSSARYSDVPNIYLNGERMLNMIRIKSRGKDGILIIAAASEVFIGESSLSPANKCDINPIILDTDFSISDTGFVY